MSLDWRRTLPPALAALAVTAVFLAAANGDFRFMEGASAIKLLEARALLSGQGYTDIGRIGRPPEIVRPPGHPAFLALVMRAGGDNILALKIASNLFAGLGVLALYALFRRRTGDPGRAALLAAAGFLFPFFITTAFYLESEVMFSAVLFSALYLIERSGEKEWKPGAGMVAAALALSVLIMLRTVGAVLAPAAVLRLWPASGPARRRAGWAAVIILAGGLTVGGWMARNEAVAPRGEMTYLGKFLVGYPVDSPYWLAEDQRVPLLKPPPAATLRDIMARAPFNGQNLLRQLLDPFWPGKSTPWWPALPVAALMLAGIVQGLRRRRETIDFFTPLYLAVILLWPYQDDRFLLPAFPLLLLYLHEGIEAIPAVRRSSRRAPALLALAAAVVVVFLGRDVSLVRRDKANHREAVLRSPGFRVTAPNPAAARSVLMLDWIAAHSGPDDRVMYHSYLPCALLTGRECSPIPMVDPERLLRYLDENNITLLVQDDEATEREALMSIFTVRFLSPLIAAHPELFRTAYQAPGSPARVWRYLGRGNPAEPR